MATPVEGTAIDWAAMGKATAINTGKTAATAVLSLAAAAALRTTKGPEMFKETRLLVAAAMGATAATAHLMQNNKGISHYFTNSSQKHVANLSQSGFGTVMGHMGNYVAKSITAFVGANLLYSLAATVMKSANTSLISQVQAKGGVMGVLATAVLASGVAFQVMKCVVATVMKIAGDVRPAKPAGEPKFPALTGPLSSTATSAVITGVARQAAMAAGRSESFNRVLDTREARVLAGTEDMGALAEDGEAANGVGALLIVEANFGSGSLVSLAILAQPNQLNLDDAKVNVALVGGTAPEYTSAVIVAEANGAAIAPADSEAAVKAALQLTTALGMSYTASDVKVVDEATLAATNGSDFAVNALEAARYAPVADAAAVKGRG